MLNKPAMVAPTGVVCVGLGPGDPELMSVKADRLVRQARHVAFFRKPGRPGKARQVVLCEGDPFLYGSFMHLYTRLQARGDVPVDVVPGIPGMVGCWHATGTPITWGDDVLSVMTGTLSEDELVRRMQTADALVIMKVGRNLPRIRRALQRCGRTEAAWLVENGTTAQQQVQRLQDVGDAACPYFAIVLVHGQGRRPEAAW